MAAQVPLEVVLEEGTQETQSCFLGLVCRCSALRPGKTSPGRRNQAGAHQGPAFSAPQGQ